MIDFNAIFGPASDVVVAVGSAGISLAACFVIYTVAIRAIRTFTNAEYDADVEADAISDREAEAWYHETYEGPLGEHPSDANDERNYPTDVYSDSEEDSEEVAYSSQEEEYANNEENVKGWDAEDPDGDEND